MKKQMINNDISYFLFFSLIITLKNCRFEKDKKFIRYSASFLHFFDRILYHLVQKKNEIFKNFYVFPPQSSLKGRYHLRKNFSPCYLINFFI